MSANCLVSMYHYVRDTARTQFPDLKALSPRDFNRQLDWLDRTHRIIDYATFEAAATRNTPLTSSSALLTFDDGFVDHYTVAFPALLDRGCSGVFFISGVIFDPVMGLLNVHKTHLILATIGAQTFAEAVGEAITREDKTDDVGLRLRDDVYRYDQSADGRAKHLLNYELPHDVSDRILSRLFEEFVGDETELAKSLYLTKEQISEMASAGMTFGFHTHRHRVLSRLDVSEQREELKHGVDLIRTLTNQRSVPFCYPYGHQHTYNEHTLTILKQFGYATAFNTVRRRSVPSLDNPYEIPRLDTRDLPPFGSALVHA